ncbi:YacP-like NYN domain-containing protein [Carex littledalei]|uniref:YacP-like NYN domain-containing protein n=1 Tax=Carex littledalei TaxID=544730 RepID=A0A833VTJ2_9POAL|nr:YacP-like NYN domain-containing protein [Carex littledalei]
MRVAVYSSYPVVEARKRKPKPNKDTDNTARRITSNVRQNLQFVKIREERNSKENQPKIVSGFRRKKGVKELEEEEDLNSDNTTEESGELVVLIDAYNLCGKWEKLRPDFKLGRLSIARDKLISSLIMYSKLREVKVVAVFDSGKSGMRANKENISRVDIVYVGRMEADDWILREVLNLKEAGTPTVVITSDSYVQSELFELGTSFWSCETFVGEIQFAEEEHTESIKRDRLRVKKSYRPVKYDLPFAIPALKTLKKKLQVEDLSNAQNTDTSTTPLSAPDPAATDLNSSNQSNGSLRKKKIPIVKLKKRGYGSLFNTLDDLKRRIN